MVPSDPQNNSFTSSLAELEHGIRQDRAVVALLPGAAFRRSRLNARQLACCHPDSRSRLLGTAFRSSATGIPFQALPRRDRRSRPIPSRPTFSNRKPVGLRPPFLHRCCWRGNFSGRHPRFPTSRTLPPASALLLPSRVFRPLGIIALEARHWLKAYLSGTPAFPPLPCHRSMLTEPRPDHHCGTVTFRQIRCS